MFLAPDGSGMTSIIADNRPHEFISIQHIGYIKDGIEDTESPEIKAWAPAFENYTFSENAGATRLKVDMDVASEYEEFMKVAWPKALAKLKAICEAS